MVPRDDPVGTDRAGRTALHYAVLDDPVGLNYTAALKDPQLAAENFRIGNTFRVENTTRLLALGADVNAVENVGMTPLHFAAQSDSVDIVRILLEANADVNAVAEDGCTPLYRAVRNTTGKRAGGAEVHRARRRYPSARHHDRVRAHGGRISRLRLTWATPHPTITVMFGQKSTSTVNRAAG